MASLVDETSTSDLQEIKTKIITHLKTHSLFIFYQNSHFERNSSMMVLEKLTFKLKEDRASHPEKNNEFSKNINLTFCDLQNEIQLVNVLQDLKISSQQFKTRIICYCNESALLALFLKAKNLAINIQSIPLCLYTLSIHSDFATFIGWGQPNIKDLSAISIMEIQRDVRRWVESPTQKIDIWRVQIKVAEENGVIHRINQQVGNQDLLDKKTHQQFFVSSLSVGYHPQLLVDYEQKRSSREPNLLNKFLFSLQGMKKFCCVGNADMKQNTGIVKVDFSDEKGHRQMLKQLADYSQFEELDHKPIRSKDKRKILSILISNISRFMGEKLKAIEGARMNDSKLEILTFRSISDATKISSASGEISMQFSPDNPVDLQVNDSYYKLERPESLKISLYSKAKVIINKETLSC